MADDEDCDPEFFELGMKVELVLQAVENTLLKAGYADFVVATKHGSFRWQTAERTQEHAANLNQAPPTAPD
jgi:hypothetical protein